MSRILKNDPPAASASGIASPARAEWLDFAKGICIFLVVMLHVRGFVGDFYQFRSHVLQHGWIDQFVAFAKPFRMPDFFLLSGLLLGRVIDRPWRRYLDTKVTHFYYFYVLWFTILFLFFYVRQSWWEDWRDVDQLIPMFFYRLIEGSLFPLWFIHSLPIYFVITKLIKKVPWLLTLSVLLVLHSLVMARRIPFLESEDFFFFDQFCVRYIYFYSGYLIAAHVFRIAAWASTHRYHVLIYLGGWVVLEHWATTTPEFAELPLVSVLLGYLGALAVIFLGCLLSTLKYVGWMQYLGKNSLIVYLSFSLPGSVIAHKLYGRIADVGIATCVATVAAIGLSILAYQLVRNTPLNFFYIRPEWAKVAQTSNPKPEQIANSA